MYEPSSSDRIGHKSLVSCLKMHRRNQYKEKFNRQIGITWTQHMDTTHEEN